jgi:hypothetical protein
MPIDVGQVVADKYELVRLLGRGSMGEVWSAHHRGLREDVAIKLLAWPPSGDDAEEPSVALARFRFEAQVAARLSRKTRHIARVTDYGEGDGLPYIVMELLDGEALDAALRARGPLPLAEAAEIVSQISRALGQAHADGVAHRDLKPANVFLTHDEDGHLLVKLLDFGIARTIVAHRTLGTFSTAKGFVFGTPGYMSPEQTRASPKLDHRCDLWALATIAYQMVTGLLPVDGSDAEEVMKNVTAGRIVPVRQRDARLPAALDAFVERAFADRVDERFQDATALANVFELACGVAPSVVPLSPPSAADASGATDIQFSATVGEEAPPAPPRRFPRAALITTGALVTVGALLMAVRAAWHEAPSSVASPAHPVEAPASAPAADSVAGAASAAELSPGILPPAPVHPAAQPVAQTEKIVAPTTRRAAVEHPSPPAASAQPNSRSVAELPSSSSRATPKPVEDRNDVF